MNWNKLLGLVSPLVLLAAKLFNRTKTPARRAGDVLPDKTKTGDVLADGDKAAEERYK